MSRVQFDIFHNLFVHFSPNLVHFRKTLSFQCILNSIPRSTNKSDRHKWISNFSVCFSSFNAMSERTKTLSLSLTLSPYHASTLHEVLNPIRNVVAFGSVYICVCHFSGLHDTRSNTCTWTVVTNSTPNAPNYNYFPASQHNSEFVRSAAWCIVPSILRFTFKFAQDKSIRNSHILKVWAVCEWERVEICVSVGCRLLCENLIKYKVLIGFLIISSLYSFYFEPQKMNNTLAWIHLARSNIRLIPFFSRFFISSTSATWKRRLKSNNLRGGVRVWGRTLQPIGHHKPNRFKTSETTSDYWIYGRNSSALAHATHCAVKTNAKRIKLHVFQQDLRNTKNTIFILPKCFGTGMHQLVCASTFFVLLLLLLLCIRAKLLK